MANDMKKYWTNWDNFVYGEKKEQQLSGMNAIMENLGLDRFVAAMFHKKFKQNSFTMAKVWKEEMENMMLTEHLNNTDFAQDFIDHQDQWIEAKFKRLHEDR